MFKKTGDLKDIMKSYATDYGVKIVATTQRTVISPRKHNFTSIVYDARSDKFYTEAPYNDIDVIDRIGSGDAYVAGVLFGLLKYGDPEKAMQFGAVTILLGNGDIVVAFRGTDGTITGWEEDFNLCYMMPVASQVEADEYLDSVMNTLAGKVYICGHSKGGNLAIYSTFHRSDEQIMRIEKVYSFDGPGFMKEVVAGAEYKRIIPKIESYLPQSSIVGMIMYSGEDYNIVHSEAHGLMQHFVLSWNVIGKEFVPDEQLKNVSIVFNSACRKWIDGISPKERRLFTHIVFKILKAPNADSFSEYSSNLIRTANSIIKSYGSLDKTTRQMIKKIVAQMIKMSRESLSEHIEGIRKPQAAIKEAHNVK